MERLKNRNLVAARRKVPRAGKPRRARADNRDPVTVGCGFLHLFVPVFEIPVRNKAFQPANADRFSLDAADTLGLALALLRADPAADGRQRVCLLNHRIGLGKFTLCHMRDKLGDPHVHRAARNTGAVLAV